MKYNVYRERCILDYTISTETQWVVENGDYATEQEAIEYAQNLYDDYESEFWAVPYLKELVKDSNNILNKIEEVVKEDPEYYSDKLGSTAVALIHGMKLLIKIIEDESNKNKD